MEARIPQPGELIAGKLLVEKVLGKGGMGVVLAARHTDLGERVAVKLLRLAPGDDTRAFERLRREARAAAKLRGEHVVRVMDVGTLESGAPYIVMEYVAGRTVAQAREAAGRIAPTTAVDWVLQACEGLAEAHGLGVVHRDIKPSNLLLTSRPDGSPLIKLLDFGIAKSVALAATTLTETGGFLGSPLYASPEQVRDARVVDHRTDIWSLGVVLYELVTGALPFPSFTATAALASLVADPPIAPRSVVADLPIELETVLLRCLEKDAQNRYENVAELARALEPLGSSAAAGATQRVVGILSQAGRSSSEPPPPSDTLGTLAGSQDESLAASRTASVVLRPAPQARGAAQRLKRWWPLAAALPVLGAIAILGTGGKAPDSKLPAPATSAAPTAPAPAPAPAPAAVQPSPAPGPSAMPEPVSAAPESSVASSKPAKAPSRPVARRPEPAVSAPPIAPATDAEIHEDFGPRK